MIPVICIPTLRDGYLQRCLDSIAESKVLVEKLVIVQNHLPGDRPRCLMRMPPNALDCQLISHLNSGVASSWNEVIKLCPAKWWMLCNDDMKFGPGDLERMALFMESDEPIACAYGNHGASWWAVTEYGIDTVGLFDENIYPAYLEDCDWSYRADLLGAKRVNITDCNAIHGDAVSPTDHSAGSRTIYSHPELRRQNGITHENNFRYYRAKWGGNNGSETFKNPFNDPNWPVWAWRFDTAMRMKQSWKL